MTPKQIFEDEINTKILDNLEYVKKYNRVYQFVILGDNGGDWHICLNNEPGVVNGRHASPDVTFTLGDENFVDVMIGKLNPQKLLKENKLEITGNITAVMDLSNIL